MLSIIVATSENNVIGHQNKIPWHMPKDLKHFALTTNGHTVIMGRNTYESIISYLGKPLPNRINIVITRNPDFKAPGCVVVSSLTDAIKQTNSESEIFVIGGSQLYSEALPVADKVYRTLIHTIIEGDAFFPELKTTEWKLIESRPEQKDEKNPFDTTYEIYERIAK